MKELRNAIIRFLTAVTIALLATFACKAQTYNIPLCDSILRPLCLVPFNSGYVEYRNKVVVVPEHAPGVMDSTATPTFTQVMAIGSNGDVWIDTARIKKNKLAVDFLTGHIWGEAPPKERQFYLPKNRRYARNVFSKAGNLIYSGSKAVTLDTLGVTGEGSMVLAQGPTLTGNTTFTPPPIDNSILLWALTGKVTTGTLLIFGVFALVLGLTGKRKKI